MWRESKLIQHIGMAGLERSTADRLFTLTEFYSENREATAQLPKDTTFRDHISTSSPLSYTRPPISRAAQMNQRGDLPTPTSTASFVVTIRFQYAGEMGNIATPTPTYSTTCTRPQGTQTVWARISNVNAGIPRPWQTQVVGIAVSIDATGGVHPPEATATNAIQTPTASAHSHAPIVTTFIEFGRDTAAGYGRPDLLGVIIGVIVLSSVFYFNCRRRRGRILLK